MVFWSRLLLELDRLDRPALVDLRDGDEHVMSEIDAYLVTLEIDQLERLQRHKLALVTLDPNSGSAFFATCARNRGLNVSIYNDIPTAARWLGNGNGCAAVQPLAGGAQAGCS